MALVMSSCQSTGGSSNSGYDGREFDISINQDKSLKAKITKTGINYEITISGEGTAISYERKESVPWNAISKRVTKVTIEEGIENIGDYFFYSIPLNQYIIPSSVTLIEENSFNEEARVYSYSTGGVSINCDNDVYLYSASKPSSSGKYWRMVGANPTIWEKYKFLFIGNSFTYHPYPMFNDSNPGVCSIFSSLADDLNLDVEVDYVTKGSHSLKKFANASDEKGAIVDEKLRASSDYDFVILQEHSTTPVNDYNSFNEGVSGLVSKINQTQDNCQVYLYATWGFPSVVSSNGAFTSVEAMEGLIRNAYVRCASENKVKVSHVGEAFTYVYKNHEQIDLYSSTDNKHQSYAGAYLSAAVHLSTILKVDVREATFRGELSQQNADLLLNVAYDLTND
jgi:hypothetical protein